MAKRLVTARLEEAQLKRARRYLKTRSNTETIKVALEVVTEKLAHDKVIRKYSGLGPADAFADS